MPKPKEQKNHDQDHQLPLRIKAVTAGAVLFVLASVLLTPLIVQTLACDSFGEFGDQFGATNALFTGLAFAFFIYTLLLQREQIKIQSQELKNQQKEMQLTREEMVLQRKETDDTQKIMDSQNELLQSQTLAINRQVFETSFFSHINTFNNLRSSLFNTDALSSMAHNLDNECRALRGACYNLTSPENHPFARSFKAFFYLNHPEWRAKLENGSVSVPNGPLPIEFARTQSVFAYFRQHDGIVPRLSAYMRSFFGILGFVSHHFLDDLKSPHIDYVIEQEEEAYRYGVIARNQLSPPEIRLIAAYCDNPYYKRERKLALSVHLFENYPHRTNEDKYITQPDFLQVDTPVSLDSIDRLRNIL